MSSVIGWDLGGANLKLAHLAGGRVVHSGANPLPPAAGREQIRRSARGGAAALPGWGGARRHHDGRAVRRVCRPGRRRRLSGRYDADGLGRRRSVLRRQSRLSRLHPRRGAVRKGRLGQLACERRAPRPDRPRRFVDRCRHHHHGSRAAQGRRGCGALLCRRRPACRRRADLYRRRAHARDGGGANGAIQAVACSASPPSALPPWPMSGG